MLLSSFFSRKHTYKWHNYVIICLPLGLKNPTCTFFFLQFSTILIEKIPSELRLSMQIILDFPYFSAINYMHKKFAQIYNCDILLHTTLIHIEGNFYLYNIFFNSFKREKKNEMVINDNKWMINIYNILCVYEKVV